MGSLTGASEEAEQRRRPKAVEFSPARTFAGKLGHHLKETFFPDDPFRRLKGKPPASKAWGALKYFIPILEWGPKYNLDKLRFDVLAGITIATLAIPQGISYCRLANLPPVIGLYSSFVPPFVYAIFGSSNYLAVGNVAAASLLLSSIIEAEVPHAQDLQLYTYTVFTATFFTGLFLLALGIFRLGILVDFLSRSTITGFMSGTACLIILQQLKGMFGLQHFTTKTDLVSVLHAVFSQVHAWKWQSCVLGVAFLCFLLLANLVKKKQPKLIYLSAIAPLMVVVSGCLFAYFAHADNHGVPIVGKLDKGLNPVSISQLQLTSKHMSVALKAGIISGFVAIAEGISVGRSFAMLRNEQVDGNKEMIACGMMNIMGSFFSCYLTTGPFSKSAVNYNAGSRTPMSNVVMALCIMLVLLVLAPYFSYTPLVALSSIIIVAMLGLIKYKEAIYLFKVDKYDFVVCMAAFLGVLLNSMVTGLLLSLGLSIIRALLHIARPATCKLGYVGENEAYCDIEHYPSSTSLPGILILQLGSSIYFTNSGYLRERILRWVEDEEKIATENGGDLQYIILDMSGMTSIDNTGIGMLRELHKILDRKGVKIALTNPRLGVVEKLQLSNFIDSIGKEWVFLSIKEAVIACHFALQESKHKEDQA